MQSPSTHASPAALDFVPQFSTPRVEIATPDDIRRANSPSTKMALALAATGKQVYQGTVPGSVIERRRAKNKAARAARRVARSHR